MSKVYPDIPVIALTAHDIAEMNKNDYIPPLAVVKKSFDLENLQSQVTEILDKRTKTFITGIALPNILQLLHMENKTCILNVQHGEYEGKLYFDMGHLIHAELNNKNGVDAFKEMVSWPKVQMEIEYKPYKKEKNIEEPLMKLLLDGLVVEDEKNDDSEFRRIKGIVPTVEIEAEHTDKANDAEVSADIPIVPDEEVDGKEEEKVDEIDEGQPEEKVEDKIEEFIEEQIDEQIEEQVEVPKPVNVPPPTTEKEFITSKPDTSLESINLAAIEPYLVQLRELKGYIASGVINNVGDVILLDSLETEIDIEHLLKKFNDIFMAAHYLAENALVETCYQASFLTPKVNLIYRCSGPNQIHHLHVATVLSQKVNLALARISLERIIPLIIEELERE
jgi:hypothetical protein